MTQPDPNAAGGDGTQTQEAAPWGEDENFDADKAKKLIANLRGENTKLKNRPVLTDDIKAKADAYDKQVAANQSDLEKAQSELTRWQSEAQTWRDAAVGSKIQALATDFADPTDAVTALASNNYLDAGGQIDENAIKRDLASTLQAKPHWAKPADQTPRAPAPNGAQGTSANGAGAKDPASIFGSIVQGALASGQ